MRTLKCITWTVLTAVLAICGSGCESLCQSGSRRAGKWPAQLQEPLVILERIGEPVKLTVDSSKENASYQWYRNGKLIEGATDDVYEIGQVGVNFVGIYNCLVTEQPQESEGKKIQPLRTHFSSPIDLMVYRHGRPIPALEGDEGSKTKSLQALSPAVMMTAMAATNPPGTPFTVWGTALASPRTGNGCPGAYSGYVNYRPGGTRWGWSMSSTTPHTGADLIYPGNKVEYVCSGGTHSNCAVGTVPTRTTESSRHACRFTIYFPPGATLPSSPHPITLTGFIE